MTEFTMDRLRENLESLKMKNTLEILDNYLERAVAENLNIVDVLDHIFAEEAKSKRKRAYEKQIQMSGFPIKKTLDDFDFSFQPSIDKRQIDELATMRFLENGNFHSVRIIILFGSLVRLMLDCFQGIIQFFIGHALILGRGLFALGIPWWIRQRRGLQKPW